MHVRLKHVQAVDKFKPRLSRHIDELELFHEVDHLIFIRNQGFGVFI